MTRCFSILFVVLLSFVSVKQVRAESLALNWDASDATEVIGYNVYYGTNSGNYPYKMDAGSATSLMISNLTSGTTYYFAATAYDANGDESGYSAEASYIIPGFVRMAAQAPGSGANPAVLEFPVAPDHWYEVQATTDMQTWTSIWQSDVATTNVWMQFTDPDAGLYASRFYRVVSH